MQSRGKKVVFFYPIYPFRFFQFLSGFFRFFQFVKFGTFTFSHFSGGANTKDAGAAPLRLLFS